jgi:hypothetical protein
MLRQTWQSVNWTYTIHSVSWQVCTIAQNLESTEILQIGLQLSTSVTSVRRQARKDLALGVETKKEQFRHVSNFVWKEPRPASTMHTDCIALHIWSAGASASPFWCILYVLWSVIICSDEHVLKISHRGRSMIMLMSEEFSKRINIFASCLQILSRNNCFSPVIIVFGICVCISHEVSKMEAWEPCLL